LIGAHADMIDGRHRAEPGAVRKSTLIRDRPVTASIGVLHLSESTARRLNSGATNR
jgi:hypothetical protein